MTWPVVIGHLSLATKLPFSSWPEAEIRWNERLCGGAILPESNSSLLVAVAKPPYPWWKNKTCGKEEVTELRF